MFPNKFKQIKDIVMQCIDILVLTKTKLDDTFPTAELLVNGFQTHTDLTEIEMGKGF